MKKRDILSIQDLSAGEIRGLFKTARELKARPLSKSRSLAGRSLALVFQKPSNRTRVSCEVGMAHLGGKAVYLGAEEVKLGTREPVKDVARVLSRYVDGIVTRTFAHDDARGMAKYATVPVINGLSDLLHPCQGLADLFTVWERFGDTDVKISFVGDGNNVLHSLLIGCALLGRHLSIAVPKQHSPDQAIVKEAKKIAVKSKARIEITDDPGACVEKADVIYTDVWVSMGQESERSEKIEAFGGFQVNRKLVARAKKRAIIMHCLPAHRGEEITDDVLDGKQSVVLDQAENRLHVQKAIFLKLLA
jgi:ornithine carbamoyltransferase